MSATSKPAPGARVTAAKDQGKGAVIVSEGLPKSLEQFAPGWKEYALLCEDLQERMDALEKGLAANPDAETQGLLLLNKAMIFHEQGDKQAAKAIVGPLAFNSNTTFATEQMARQTLAMIGS